MPRKKSTVVGQLCGADKANIVLPAMVDTIAKIRYWHRQRCAAMESRKTLDLRCGAHLRTFLGWSKQLSEAERKTIAAQAANMIASGEAGEWTDFIAAFAAARLPFDVIEARALKEMSALAITLPAWASFGEPVRGFGSASLAVIVAEAGDLSNYSNPAKLWKRMGLAVMGDVRQGGLAKNAGAEAWIAHGYNPQRRSRMWNIGDTLIKGNRDGAYRAVYLERKAYELARDPDMRPIKAHRRAQRYMEKRLLKNLWQAWRRAAISLRSGSEMPAAETQQTVVILSPGMDMSAPRSANGDSLPTARVPSATIHAAKARAVKRRAVTDLHPSRTMPAATHSAQAERSAIGRLPPVSPLPSESIPAKAGKRRAALRLSP